MNEVQAIRKVRSVLIDEVLNLSVQHTGKCICVISSLVASLKFLEVVLGEMPTEQEIEKLHTAQNNILKFPDPYLPTYN